MTVLATEQASATAGRGGKATSQDGKIDLELSAPGSNGPGTNPEQLFAAGYSACFGGAVMLIAKNEGHKLDTNAVTVDTTIRLHKEDDKGLFIDATLNVTINGVDQDEAESLVLQAHEMCPYSKATRGNVDVTPKVDGQALKAAA